MAVMGVRFMGSSALWYAEVRKTFLDLGDFSRREPEVL